MQHRRDHNDPVRNELEGELCPQCHGESPGDHPHRNGAVRQHPEALEHSAHSTSGLAQYTFRADAGRAVTTRMPDTLTSEQTLWQGRPAMIATTLSLGLAAVWTGIWGLALLQYHTIAAALAQWHPHVQEWLFAMGAFELARLYRQGATWLRVSGFSEAILGGVLLALTLGSLVLVLSRFRRLVGTSYCLTTHRLSTRQGAQWADVRFTELEQVTIRRPFWGRWMGYVHLLFVGHYPVTRRVRWWGIPQRALLRALLQATLDHSYPVRRRDA